ncbi:MAG TPA: hypothetical protein VFW33_10320 [Gemmataceae bacterium]|nr:hypothetical protein [Gemmataceae bacterium]
MSTATQLDCALPPETREFYAEAMRALDEAGVPFLVGGAYALHAYTGIERHTKDFDVFVRPADCRRALGALAAMGCRTELTFPHWLGKAYRGDDFIDVIFSSGNGVATVDDSWFEHAVAEEVLGRRARLVPAEEIIWQKSFIQERERYDGADVAHIIRALGPDLDWRRLLARFGPHWRVLFGQLVTFGFVYPSERDRVPAWVMNDLTTRLLAEVTASPPEGRVCQGTLLSREQYLIDIERWGYTDARERPQGPMSHADIVRWTQAITTDPSPPMEHTVTFGPGQP